MGGGGGINPVNVGQLQPTDLDSLLKQYLTKSKQTKQAMKFDLKKDLFDLSIL